MTLGAGTIALSPPRVRDIPTDQAPFESKILRKHQRRSDTIDETFLNLFVEGLATRDFEPALRLLVGQDAPLSPSTISRLTKQFKGQYDTFDRQDLTDRKFVYIWADGIYLKAGLVPKQANFDGVSTTGEWGAAGAEAGCADPGFGSVGATRLFLKHVGPRVFVLGARANRDIRIPASSHSFNIAGDAARRRWPERTRIAMGSKPTSGTRCVAPSERSDTGRS